MGGWILIGAIGAAAAINAINESNKTLDEELGKLTAKWENKVQTIEERLEALEKDIGIKRPPHA